MGNLKDMDTVLEKYDLLELNQEERENMNRPIISMEIKTVIKNVPKNKHLEPDGFTGDFYHMFTKELIPIPLKIF